MKLFVTLIYLGLLATINPLLTYAQSDVSISISASITSSIELITIQTMRLSKKDAQNNVIRINPNTSSNAGKMIATGTPNSEVRITFLERRVLTRIEGTESLTINYSIAGNNQDNQQSAELLKQGNRDLSFNAEGKFYLWIGGTVDISTAAPGNYNGEFTLEIEYI